MASSAQITEAINNSPNPEAMKHKFWMKTRYLVAQKPAVAAISVTKPGYYKGRVVIPGPQANPKLSEVLDTHDLNILENQHFIRFVDNKVTETASDDIVQGLYTIMSKAEADEYEHELKKHVG